jgi:RHS repeat-associated protein
LRSTVNDNQAANLRFTGKELDKESHIGLYYFGARYYDPSIGRFISVDPLADKYPGLTPYHYAANNPLKYVDPDGRKVEIYSVPIGIAGIKTGHKHLFIVVRNKNTGTFTSRGLYPKNYWKAAKSIVTKGKSIPVVHKDKKSELGEVKKLYAGKKSNTTLETVIDIPEGMTEEEFDQKTLEEADNYPVDKKPYDANEGPNSNTFVDDVVEGAGGTMPDIPGATQQNYGEKKKDEKDE